jgi:hypothetical protein
VSAPVLDAFSRLIGVTLCWVVALAVWDIGHYAPARALRSLSLAGAMRFVVGLGAAFVALLLLIDAFPPGEEGLFSAYAIGTFLAALAVDLLIGDALRSIARIKR